MDWASNSGVVCTGTFTPNASGHGVEAEHRHADGSWWFVDETGADEYGPFKDKESATESCIRYVKECL